MCANVNHVCVCACRCIYVCEVLLCVCANVNHVLNQVHQDAHPHSRLPRFCGSGHNDGDHPQQPNEEFLAPDAASVELRAAGDGRLYNIISLSGGCTVEPLSL